MPATRAEAQAFVQRFDALHRTQASGARGMNAEELVALVRETNPDVVALAARSYLEVAFNPKLVDERNAMLQRAIAISGAYESVHDDDSVSRMVQRKMKEEGVSVAPFMTPVQEPGHDAMPPILVNVDAATLASGDPYPIVSLFSFDAQPASKWKWLSTHRGRLVIGFDVPMDGPEAFDREDVRAFMAELLRRLPYLGYFIDTRPEWGMPRLVMFSLVDREAVAGPGQLNLHHPSSIGVVFALAIGIRMACERTLEPFEAAAHERLSYLPPELVTDTLTALGTAT